MRGALRALAGGVFAVSGASVIVAIALGRLDWFAISLAAFAISTSVTHPKHEA